MKSARRQQYGVTLFDLIVVVVFICALVVILSLISSPVPAQGKIKNVDNQILVEQLGEEWENVRPGDLVQFEEGQICLINAIGFSGVSFDAGAVNFVRGFDRLEDVEFLFKRGDGPEPNPDYIIILDEFIQQNYGERGG